MNTARIFAGPIQERTAPTPAQRANLVRILKSTFTDADLQNAGRLVRTIQQISQGRQVFDPGPHTDDLYPWWAVPFDWDYFWEFFFIMLEDIQDG